jgi:hypothetical protein
VCQQLVQINVDLIVIVVTTCLTIALAFGVVSKTLHLKLIGPLSSHTTIAYLCLIKVFLFILAVVNLR